MSVSKPRKCSVAKNPSLASQLPFPSSLPIWAVKAWLFGLQRWRRGIGRARGWDTMNDNTAAYVFLRLRYKGMMMLITCSWIHTM